MQMIPGSSRYRSKFTKGLMTDLDGSQTQGSLRLQTSPTPQPLHLLSPPVVHPARPLPMSTLQAATPTPPTTLPQPPGLQLISSSQATVKSLDAKQHRN